MLLKSFKNNLRQESPIWIMRQAGRYLPEYRKVREKFSDFIEFCLNSEAAAEVTIQPLRRFALDAAIVFSDILIIPHALGAKVFFKEGHGPILEIVDSREKLNSLKEPNKNVFEKIGKTLKLVKKELEINFPEVNLIGFAGAPFTVAAYMVEGGSSKDFKKVFNMAYKNPDILKELINIITDATIEYLSIQIESGAQVIKIFDSWAGVVPAGLFEALIIEPTSKIVMEIKAKFPHTPIIGFARGAGSKLKTYALKTNVDCVAIDQYTAMHWVVKNIKSKVIQGNMDNMLLAFGNKAQIKREAEKILKCVNGPHIFNLGHGVLPQTPVDNVKFLVETVKEYGRNKY